MKEDMAIHKRLNISLHPLELDKLDKIAIDCQETRSGMIARLIQEYQVKKK
jgi:metal-responsive CopG/Arc/MetJ family transcriptional regulator